MNRPDHITILEGRNAVTLSIGESLEVVRELAKASLLTEILQATNEGLDEREAVTSEEDKPIRIQGRVLIQGTLTPEKALALEQFLNDSVSLSVGREFGVGLRVHLEEMQ